MKALTLTQMSIIVRLIRECNKSCLTSLTWKRQKNVQTVASATRNTSTGRKQNRIELTPSEQALAKKLGVSFKDYAIQKARLQKS